jgi:hypothetical protein
MSQCATSSAVAVTVAQQAAAAAAPAAATAAKASYPQMLWTLLHLRQQQQLQDISIAAS